MIELVLQQSQSPVLWDPDLSLKLMPTLSHNRTSCSKSGSWDFSLPAFPLPHSGCVVVHLIPYQRVHSMHRQTASLLWSLYIASDRANACKSGCRRCNSIFSSFTSLNFPRNQLRSLMTVVNALFSLFHAFATFFSSSDCSVRRKCNQGCMIRLGDLNKEVK